MAGQAFQRDCGRHLERQGKQKDRRDPQSGEAVLSDGVGHGQHSDGPGEGDTEYQPGERALGVFFGFRNRLQSELQETLALEQRSGLVRICCPARECMLRYCGVTMP